MWILKFFYSITMASCENYFREIIICEIYSHQKFCANGTVLYNNIIIFISVPPFLFILPSLLLSCSLSVHQPSQSCSSSDRQTMISELATSPTPAGTHATPGRREGGREGGRECVCERERERERERELVIQYTCMYKPLWLSSTTSINV